MRHVSVFAAKFAGFLLVACADGKLTVVESSK